MTYTLTTTISAELDPGGWEWSIVVVSGSTRETVDAGTITILPDPSKAHITRNQRILALLQDRLEGRLVDETESFSYLGTSINKMSVETLQRLHDKYACRVSREHRAARTRVGKKNGNFKRGRLRD